MIKNFLFSFFFYLGIIVISVFFIPAFFLPQKIILLGGKLMGLWTAFCLKFFLSVKIILKGEDNIIKNEKFFIASSHQSMFETFFLQTIFNSPVFILKKELLLIPVFGWYLKKIGSIPIKRNKVSRENIGFLDQISNFINTSDRPLIIFPQGTRMLPEDRLPFKKGAARIYKELNIACQPVAINSGQVWPKKGLKKINSHITISILKPINPGLNQEIFLENLENYIYSELNLIN
jgi:1-acyl-sn-glycerol-3-phosphate acyltransferase